MLLAAFQGLIIGILLFYTRINKASNRLLAVLLWLISLASLNLFLGTTGLYYSTTAIAIIHALVPMVIIMPIGPLIFLYTQSAHDPAFRIQKRHGWHFLSLIIDLVPQLTALIFFAGSFSGVIKTGPQTWGSFIDSYNVYSDIPRWFSLTIYVWLAHKHLSVTSNKIQGPSLYEKKKSDWLRQFLNLFMAFQFIWLLYLIPYVIPTYTDFMLDTVGWYPVYIPLAVLVYWLGLKGYIINYSIASGIKGEKTGKPLLPSAAMHATAALLMKSMEHDKQFLNPSLNLDCLSEYIGVAPKTISKVINQHFGKNFNDFVNDFRVAEFKRRILDHNLAHLTINGIAADCGFNSPATFQRAFKQSTGMSPTDFRKSAQILS